MKGFWQGFEKRAFLSIGLPVWSSENNRHHINVGFPNPIGYSYSLKDGPGWSPAIGVGVFGPNFGITRKGEKAVPVKKPAELSEGAKDE